MMMVKEWERKRGRGGRKDGGENILVVFVEGWVKELLDGGIIRA